MQQNWKPESIVKQLIKQQQTALNILSEFVILVPVKTPTPAS